MHSAIYRGCVSHRRHAPRPHAFRYDLYMAYLDLDELDEVFRGRWFWSARGAALVRFDRRDHLGDPGTALQDAVRDLVADRTGERPQGPVRLLTNLRHFGYVFNPVSFFYCFDRAGQKVEAIVAEVNNTPWGERHCYVLRPGDGLEPPASRGESAEADARWVNARSTKAMHVSPFNPMELDYLWHFGTPGERLAVRMRLLPSTGGGPAPFDAALHLRREPISARTLAGTLARYPLMTAKVIAAIHWEALRLWWKGVPVHDHPRHASASAPTTDSHPSRSLLP